VVIRCDRYGKHVIRLDSVALGTREPMDGLERAKLVLMTGMGAGLTWGSGLIE